MKYSILLIFMLCVGLVYAQPCQPDTSIKSAGNYPSNLPPTPIGVPYEGIVQFRIPTDTIALFNGNLVNVTVDSIEVLSVQNLPQGFNYDCNPSSCILPATQTSCGRIYGTAQAGSDGVYRLVIPVIIYARVFGFLPVPQADTIRSITMFVGNVGVNKSISHEISSYPNPANEALFIKHDFDLTQEIKILDFAGRMVNCPNTNQDGIIHLDTRLLNNGVYLAIVQTEKGLLLNRFIVAH
jgi:hypothetical protein